MYARLLRIPYKSFFLFGPRGTGKTSWVKQNLPNSLYLDLLEAELYKDLLANPQRLEKIIPPNFAEWIVIDEVQKIPELLNEVHRLIEKENYKFVLTGSSARSLRRRGVNLLAGRALTCHMHPLTAIELKQDFSLERALLYGCLPAVFKEEKPQNYLTSYINTYLREEIQYEGLTRNLGNFTRFLESASFSQGAIVNFSAISRECSIPQKTVTGFFDILDDLLIGYRLPVFSKHTKRRLIAHPKFYYFDVGVYKAIRPKGPLDTYDMLDGLGLETLFLEELRAVNDYFELGFSLFYWHTSDGQEVDFIVYGEKGFFAFEIKHTRKPDLKDFRGLKAFHKDYPMAKLYLLCNVTRREYHGNIEVIPFVDALYELPNLIN